MKYLYMCVLSLVGLVHGHAQSQLIFSYDASGNQVSRRLCIDGDCSDATNVVADVQETELFSMNSQLTFEERFSNAVTIYPNPTQGQVLLEWLPEYTNSIQKIFITDSSGFNSFFADIDTDTHSARFDLTHYLEGVYIIKFYLDNAQLVTKKLIKN